MKDINDPDIMAMEQRSNALFAELLRQIDNFDNGLLTRPDLIANIKVQIARHVEKTYDAAFMRGLEEAEIDPDGSGEEIDVELMEDDEDPYEDRYGDDDDEPL